MQPGQPGSGENGFFRPVFAGGPAKGYSITGVPLPSEDTVGWSSGGFTGTSTGKLVRTYRANVVSALPRDANGNISANGTYEVRLPNVGNNTPLTLGATLVLIYRVFDPTVSLNSIVIYDGGYNPGGALLTMSQTVQGFYDAANVPVSRMTQIVADGKINKFQTVKLDGVTLPSLYGNTEPPFPGYYGTWDNPTWTFPSPGILASFKNPIDAGDAAAEIQVTPTASNGGCVSWGAMIVATTVQNTDGDGLLDVWKSPKAPYSKSRPGYCDAAVNQGICIQGGPNWVDLPGAVLGTAAKPHPDVYVQYDYMCSKPNADGNTCLTGDGTNYSFNPTLQLGADGFNPVQEVANVYAAHGITLHVNAEANPPNQLNVHAIQEQSCQDSVVKGKEELCIFPNPAGTTINKGVVAWPGGVTGFEQEEIFAAAPTNVADLTYCANSPIPLGCVPRFQPAAAPAKHYGLFAHAVGQPKWSLFNGTLVSATQSGTSVTFTTSAPVGSLYILGKDAVTGKTVNDPTCPYGRITVVGAITNDNLDGTFCVNSFNTAGDTFTITVGGTAVTASYTAATDPSLALVPPYTSTQSGIADVGGHHFVVSLGLWGNPAFNGVSAATSPESDGQTPAVIASTLMHEQGHAIFTLAHGGPAAKALESPQLYQSPLYLSVTTNCKVNYLSVMSYSRQLDLLDYSESALADIDKATLMGSLSGVLNITHWYVPFPAAVDAMTGKPIGSAAAFLCTGPPVPNGESMTEVTGPAETFSWISLSGTNTDINLDGSIYPGTAENFLGACDWCVGSYDLAQTDASGSYLSSSGPPFGGGGPPFGGGGPPFGGGGPPFGGGGPPFGGGGPPFGGGGPPFGGGGEIDLKTAQAVTPAPQGLAASEAASSRTITLTWTKPFGDLGAYNIYRSPGGGTGFTLIATVSGNPPATTYMDTVTCNPTGYQYFVTAVQSASSTNPNAESTPSNIVTLGQSTGLLTGCYTVTNFSSPSSGVQGTQVVISWTLQDDFNPTNNPVSRLAANTLVAIGPLPGNCNTPTFGRTTLVANGTVAYAGDTFTDSGDQFTFTWNSTDSFCAGSYTFELDLDHAPAPSGPPAQVVTDPTALRLAIDVGDTDTTPHITTLALSPGTVGVAYSYTLAEDGGTAPFTWTFTSGLPTGITQSGSSSMLAGTTCYAGTYSFTAMVTDAKANSGLQALTLQIAKATTTTSVMSNVSPASVFQQAVTFTVTVAPQSSCTPTGTVTLSIDGTAVGSNTLSGGMASFTTATLPVGMHKITASYAGDSNFTASNSNSSPLPQTVNRASTTITYASASPNPAVVGQSITVAYNFAVAAPGAGTPTAPTGSITVLASDGSMCSVLALQGPGMCTLVPAATVAGNLTFTVTYAGDTNFLGSGANGNYTVNIYVSDATVPPFTPVTNLPNAVVGAPYSNTVYENGGVTTGANNFSWTIVADSVMPGGGSTLPGLSFPANAAGVYNGTLSGTPAAPGTYTFTAMVTDSAGNTGTQTFALRVFSGDLIVADGSPSASPLAGTLLRITPGGTSSTIANILNGSPQGVAVDPSTGNIYAAVTVPPVGSGTASVVKVTAAGVLTTFTSGGVLANPVAVAVDASKNVYVADNSAHAVYKFNSSGTQVDANGNTTSNALASLPATAGNSLNNVRMAFDSSGRLDVASDNVLNAPPEGVGIEVDQIATNGTLTVLYNTNTNSNLSQSITSVGGIAVLSSGSIDVADYEAQAIYTITNPGAGNMAVSTAIASNSLCCNISGMANRLSQVNTTLYLTLNSSEDPGVVLAVPETSTVSTVLNGAPLTSPNDVAWYDYPAAPPQGPPPLPASSLAAPAADLTASQVGLTWTASPTATVTGYNVYRGTMSGGPYTKVNGSPVAGSPFTDTTVTTGTMYYYVVSAVDTNNVESVFSNEASATPEAPPHP